MPVIINGRDIVVAEKCYRSDRSAAEKLAETDKRSAVGCTEGISRLPNDIYGADNGMSSIATITTRVSTETFLQGSWE